MDSIYYQPEVAMAERAKLFRTGGSQAVRLPKKYRFEGRKEVLIRREGKRVVLEDAKRTWTRRFIELAGSAKDFPYPPEPPSVESGPDFRDR
jgi:antitoxin VapB